MNLTNETSPLRPQYVAGVNSFRHKTTAGSKLLKEFYGHIGAHVNHGILVIRHFQTLQPRITAADIADRAGVIAAREAALPHE